MITPGSAQPKMSCWAFCKDLDDAVGFQLAIGPAGEVYREAGKLAEERHDEIATAPRAQLAKYKGPNGVMMDSSSWKVTARNPR